MGFKGGGVEAASGGFVLREFDFLNGKRVALVGGADCYDESELDWYDYVVRINHHWLRRRGRIDVLYSTQAGHVREFVKELPVNLKLVIASTSDCWVHQSGGSAFRLWCEEHGIPFLLHQRKPMVGHPDNDGASEFFFGVRNLYAPLFVELFGPSQPMAGTMAAYLLWKYAHPRVLHLYGFTFYSHLASNQTGGHRREVDKFILQNFEFR